VPRCKCNATLLGVSRLTKRVTNIAASVGQKLRNIARERNEDFALVLTKFGLERLLFRLSQSKHRDSFVLKGALLFELWTEERYRSTRDADLLARGDNSPERLADVFRDVCTIAVVDDGLRFDAQTVKAERITEDANYQGVRVTFIGYLESARIPIQIDIGFGDVVTPAPAEAEFPTLLDFPAPKLLAYPKESFIAEKFEAIVKLGIANSRMKDFYDLWKLSRDFRFDGPLLSEAVRKTFARRETELLRDKLPVVFTEEFYRDEIKNKQWNAFCKKNRRYLGELPLEEVCLAIRAFLMPIVEALVRNEPLQKRWNASGPWE
jgi:predicted nucleotidyltransferase component of viral defense system